MADFEDVTLEGMWLRASIEGPSGSGKTTTAVRIALGLVDGDGSLVGVIDAEKGRAKSVPANARNFKHLILEGYTVRHYVEAIRKARQRGLKAIVIDQLSSLWEHLLDEKAEMDSGNKKEGFSNWKKINVMCEAIWTEILAYPGHVIVTYRSKMKHAISGSDVVRIGVEPIQRPGSEYEVDLQIDMSMDSVATLAKRPRGVYIALEGMRLREPGEDLGRQIVGMLAGLPPPEVKPIPSPASIEPAKMTADDLKAEMDRLLRSLGADRCKEIKGAAQYRTLASHKELVVKLRAEEKRLEAFTVDQWTTAAARLGAEESAGILANVAGDPGAGPDDLTAVQLERAIKQAEAAVKDVP